MTKPNEKCGAGISANPNRRFRSGDTLMACGNKMPCKEHPAPVSNEKCGKCWHCDNGYKCIKDWTTDKVDIPYTPSPVSNEKCGACGDKLDHKPEDCIKGGFVKHFLPRSPVDEQEGWEKEFYEENFKARYGVSEKDEVLIKDFFRELLSSHNLSLVEAVEGANFRIKTEVAGIAGILNGSAVGDTGQAHIAQMKLGKILEALSALDAVIEIIKPKV